jgi:hypothetical protein
MIAEQILNKKPMRNLSYVDYKQLKENLTNNTLNLENISCNSFDNQNDKKNDIIMYNQELDYEKVIIKEEEINESNDIPEWLKNDIKECEFIPIEALNKSLKLCIKDQQLDYNIDVINY